MNQVHKFKELLNDNLVSELFHKREDTIYNRTEIEKEEIKGLLDKNHKDYERILVAIENVPDAFVETKKLLKDSIDAKLEAIGEVCGYDNEKFYKIGVYDGVNFIIECLNNKL